jgi:endoglucanase
MRLKTRLFYVFWGIVLMVSLTITLGWSQTQSIAASPRMLNLTDGINFSHWFFIPEEGHKIDRQYLDKWVTEREVKDAAMLGFKHIRVPLDPDVMQPSWKKGNFQVDESRLQYLDRALEYTQKYSLSIILDVHAGRKLNLEAGLKSGDYARLSTLWKVLSTRYKGASRRLAYEILNEPQVENEAQWRTVAQQLINEIRQNDLMHRIIVPASGFSGISDLVDFLPLQGDRLIYTFHFYNPMPFTHQGAKWIDHYEKLRNVPYPMNLNAINKSVPMDGSQIPPETQKLLEEYQAKPFGRENLAFEIKQMTQWRDRNQVEIYCGEYGVHDVAPKADRYRWHQDISSILKQEGIGGAMWSYRGNFGVIPDGQMSPDLSLLQAIGLTPNPA